MDFIWNYVRISLYPVAAVLVCGFIVWGCRRFFMELLGYCGYHAVLAASIIGTPVHELGHAVMCLLFGHRIDEIVLWQPHSWDDRLGYVEHSYDPDSLYQRLGNLFIGAGPIFSGMAVLSLLLFFAFPSSWSAYTERLGLLVQENGSVLRIVASGLGLIPDLFAELFGGSLWLRLTALLAMLSVSLHISLSPADLEGAATALPLYLMIALAVTVVASLLGFVPAVLSALRSFHVFMTAMFTVVLVFSAGLAALALAISLLLRR